MDQANQRRSKKDLAVESKPKVKKEGDTYVVSVYPPEEIVTNILPRLPVESLLRFRCVSKPWLSLISQITNGVQKVLIASGQPSRVDDGHLWLRSIDQNTLVEDIGMVVPGLHDAHICGWCNGLLLIGFERDLFLWNPSTRSCVSHWPTFYTRSNTRLIGLCFDSNNNEYKVVKALSTHVSVGSFKTHLWKLVSFQYLHLSFELGPVLNNSPHWFRNSWPDLIIVYFDPMRNEFIDVPVPVPSSDRHNDIASLWGLGVLDGCLCMARTLLSTTTEVLVMKEHGVKESWTILFKFQWGPGGYFACTPLFFTNEKKCEVLMYLRLHNEEKIVSFDIDKNVYKEIAVGNLRNSCIEPLVYEETVIRPTWRREKETEALDSSKHVWKLKKDDEI